MRTLDALLLFALLVVVPPVAGCPTANTLPTPSYAAKTTLTTASSARCATGVCRCQPLGNEAEPALTAGKKRFELRLPRSTSEIWVEVAGHGVMYKAAQTVDPQCAYVDLAPGEHRITVHARGGDPEVGLQSGLTIHEYGKPADHAPNWYRSFHYACGKGASPCTDLELIAWKQAQQRLPRGVLDPCGSVRALRVQSSGSRTRKNDEVYRDLTMAFSLKVYRFAPYLPAGSPKCQGPTKNH